MIVVSDTSPITNLIQIGALHLLKELYKRILIPQEVYKELCHLPQQELILTQIPWIEVVDNPATKEIGDRDLLIHLDRGEAEAILLAKEIDAEF